MNYQSFANSAKRSRASSLGSFFAAQLFVLLAPNPNGLKSCALSKHHPKLCINNIFTINIVLKRFLKFVINKSYHVVAFKIHWPGNMVQYFKFPLLPPKPPIPTLPASQLRAHKQNKAERSAITWRWDLVMKKIHKCFLWIIFSFSLFHNIPYVME